MKKLSFIFMLFLAVNSYAQESKFKELDGYGLLSEKGCSYKTKDGKTGVELGSNICVRVYKTDIKDLDKAYEEYIKENEYKELFAKLSKKAPEKQKDKNKIHIRISYRGVDYNILFEKKDDGVYVYSHLGLISEKNSIGEAKAEYESDKLKYYETRSVLIGENLKNTVSGVVIQKAYSLKDNIYYHIYEVNTSDIDEAYKIINEFRNEKYNTNYPLTLDKNKNTERINSDYVTTDYDVMEVGIYTLELKKQGNKVVGIVEITGN